MKRAYSVDGFELRVDGRILEMRTEGDRGPGMDRNNRRTLESFLASGNVRGVLFDVRRAHYRDSGVESDECIRTLARICRRHFTAVIGRADQSTPTGKLVGLHAQMGGHGRAFRSRDHALEWLDRQVAATPAR